MLYQIEKGPIAESSYGIALARTMVFPPTFIARAEEVAAALRDRAAARKRAPGADRTAARRRLLLRLRDNLKALAEGTVTDDAELGRRLKSLQVEFNTRLKALVPEDPDEVGPEIDSEDIGKEIGDRDIDYGDIDDEEINDGEIDDGDGYGSDEEDHMERVMDVDRSNGSQMDIDEEEDERDDVELIYIHSDEDEDEDADEE